MNDSVETFINHLRTERQASMHTVRSYEDDLALYSSYLAEFQGDQVDPTAADSVRLRRYSAWLSGRGYASSTVARRLASLRLVLPLPAQGRDGDGGSIGRAPKSEAGETIASIAPR